MANVEQMLNNHAEYWTKSLENIGVYWRKLGKIWLKLEEILERKMKKIWEKNFEKKIGKIFEGE